MLSKSSFAVKKIIGVLIQFSLISFAILKPSFSGSITSKIKISYLFFSASLSQSCQFSFKVTKKLFSSKYSQIFGQMI